MARIVFTNYYTGKTVKTIKVKEGASSITFGPEDGRFVIRDYHTGKKVQSCKEPDCSYRYEYKD